MTRFEKWSVLLASLATALTGAGYFWTKYLVESTEPWAVINHPWQPWLLKAHILVAPLLVFAVGMIAMRHVWRHFRSGIRRARRSGLATALSLLPMLATGYLIQVTTAEPWLRAAALSHIVVSVLFSVGLVLHYLAARRRAAGSAAPVPRGGGSGARAPGREARSMPGLGVALCLALALGWTTPARAQVSEPPLDVPGWAGDLASLGGNALLGGITAGVAQKARGGSFQDGFTRGALGGMLVYGGKRLVVEEFAGAGLLGREVAAVGASVVRNAADGRPGLERVMLPVGPLHLYLRRGAGPLVSAKLDLATLVSTGYAIAAPELEWDAAASLSAGAPVFTVENLLLQGRGEEGAPEDVGASGVTRAGTVYLSELAGLDFEEDFAHERVHLVHYDQVFLTWTAPAEDWLLRRVPGGERLGRVADLNLSPLVIGGLARLFSRYEHRPWELEAEYLARK